jgi:DNA (cytosine-5)-methyltransferase 1
LIKKKYSIADFFAGCGGLSYGFGLTGRFNVLLGSDIKPEALETFVENHEHEHGKPEAILEDIQKVAPESVRKMLARFGVSKEGQLDCLIGGPPCEGFSQNRSINAGGKVIEGTASRVNRFMDDPRNQLFKWFVELAAHLKPKVVLIENVPDLVRHKDGATLKEILLALDRAGYVTSVRVLHAADYGVPQMRRRAIFLGQRKEDLTRTGLKLQFPEPTHKPFPLHYEGLEDDRLWLPGDSGYWPSVWEAIGDLPTPPTSGSQLEAIPAEYPFPADSELRRYYRDGGEQIYNHIARPLGKNGLEKVRSIVRGQAAADLPDHLRPKASYHYSYARLRWSEPARTITKFCYHVGSGMFAHPVEDRALTMREAARLQTFPDSFRFVSDNIRDLSAMIGSAVPPLLARRIAWSVSRYLDELQFADLSHQDQELVRPQATDPVLKRLQHEEWGHEAERFEQPALFSEDDEVTT